MSGTTRRKNRMTKAERRRRQRRNRMIRAIALYGCAAAICIACLAMIPVLNRPIDQQTSWYVEDGAMEILAAPVVSQTVLTTAEGSYDAAVTTQNISAIDEGDFFAAVPDVPTHADGQGGATAAEPVATPEPSGPVSITITAAGDCTLGGCLKHDTFKVFKAYVDQYGYDYFLANVRSVFEADDLTIVNLEGPLTDVGTMTTKSGICFRGEPEWTAILTGSSVELCNFANNHAMDMGQEGFDRTLQALDDAGLGCCAYDLVYRTTIKGVRVTALGFDKWNNKEPEVVEVVRRERANCDLLIVNFHWGREMHYEPMSDQKKMGHAIIDAGADLVIGTHPHVYGGVEKYNGKYICYSLGNFCFGGNTVPSDQRAMMFQQTFEFSADGAVTDGGINVIPCLVSGNPKKNDFQPYILGEKAGTSLLKNIAKYSNLNRDTLWVTNSYPEQIGLIETAEVKAGSETSAGTAQVTTAVQPEQEIEDISGDEVNDGFEVGTPDVQVAAGPLGSPQADTDPSAPPRLGDQLSSEEIAALQEKMYLEQMTK